LPSVSLLSALYKNSKYFALLRAASFYCHHFKPRKQERKNQNSRIVFFFNAAANSLPKKHQKITDRSCCKLILQRRFQTCLSAAYSKIVCSIMNMADRDTVTKMYET
jgi:hypothetical protein